MVRQMVAKPRGIEGTGGRLDHQASSEAIYPVTESRGTSRKHPALLCRPSLPPSTSIYIHCRASTT